MTVGVMAFFYSCASKVGTCAKFSELRLAMRAAVASRYEPRLTVLVGPLYRRCYWLFFVASAHDGIDKAVGCLGFSMGRDQCEAVPLSLARGM